MNISNYVCPGGEDDDLSMRAKQIEIYRNMTPAERWREAERLRQTAWKMKSAGVRDQHPDWTEEQVMARVRELFQNAAS